MITELIASHLKEAFEGENWSEVNIMDTVNDISFSEAVTVTRASPNTIASLLFHITFYNKIIYQRLIGEEPETSAANGFDMPEINSEENWVHLKNDALSTAQKLSDIIRSFPDERLMEEKPEGKGTFYRKLQGIIEHNYYHLGQIVILKKLIRSK